MEKSDVRSRAMALHAEGYSLQEIADQLEMSKSSVHRLVKSVERLNDDEDDFEEEIKPNSTTTKSNSSQFQRPIESRTTGSTPNNDANAHYYRLQERQIELEHEREMLRLQQHDKQLEIDKMKLLHSKDPTALKKGKGAERRGRMKKVFMKRFRRLMEELLENCKDATWEYEEVEDYTQSISEIKEEIEDFIIKHSDDDFEDFLIWVRLDAIETQLVDVLDNCSTGRTVQFNFDSKNISALEEALTSQDFNEKA